MNNLDKVYFKSKTIGKLSSQNLNELKFTLNEMKKGKNRLKNQISSADIKLNKEKSKLSWINWFPFNLLLKTKIQSKKNEISAIQSELNKLEQDFEKHKLGLEIVLTNRQETAFGTLDDEFSKVMSVEQIWDITTSQSIDRIVERTTANHMIERKKICFKKSKNNNIQCDYKAFHFENANGGDLHIFPQFILVESDDDFALLDLLDVNIDFTISNFIETESVPNDAEIVEYTWAKSNKDGSRDKRFTDNFQIPVIKYGELHLNSKSGLNEVYMFSHPESAYGFKKMFDEYKKVLDVS